MIYLDHAATSFPKPAAVSAAVQHYLCAVGANPGRSGHSLSAEAARIVYETRAAVAELLGVGDARRVIFTLNATAALNQAMSGFLRHGDHVITTSLEHNSVMRPLRHLSQTLQLSVDVVVADRLGRLDPGAFRTALKPQTRLVIVNHASNVVGTIAPLGEIRRAIGAVPLLVDAAQSAGAVPIDVDGLGIDLLAFTGHKSLFGPQGTGGLCLRPGIEIEPLMHGGTGSGSDSDAQPSALPDRLESGTPNGPGLAGLGAGVAYVAARGIEAVQAHEGDLRRELITELQKITGVEIVGDTGLEEQLPTVSIRLPGMVPNELGYLLDRRYAIMTRAGIHCAPAAHRTLGTFPEGTVRLSAGLMNSVEEMRQAVAAVAEIASEIAR